jgi:hypothetical protein
MVTFLRCMTKRRGMDWISDLLTTYTHHWELQAITALLLIYTIHSSTQHLLRPFQTSVSSPAGPWQLLLTADSPASRTHIITSPTLIQTAFPLSPPEC